MVNVGLPEAVPLAPRYNAPPEAPYDSQEFVDVAAAEFDRNTELMRIKVAESEAYIAPPPAPAS